MRYIFCGAFVQNFNDLCSYFFSCEMIALLDSDNGVLSYFLKNCRQVLWFKSIRMELF